MPIGGNYATIKSKILEYGLDTSHFTGQGWSDGQKYKHPVVPIQFYLDNRKSVSSNDLKQKLIKTKSLVEICSGCHQTESKSDLHENGVGKIPLELDHINGNHDDNTLSNLRLLCPNCHALTENYRGKNQRKTKLEDLPVFEKHSHFIGPKLTELEEYKPYATRQKFIGPIYKKVRTPRFERQCIDCGIKISKGSKVGRCNSCTQYAKNGTNWPSDEALQALIDLLPMTKVGVKLGVSDNAVRKRCQKLGITKTNKQER